MNPDVFKHRTKQIGLRIIRVVRALPKDFVGRSIGQQLLKSGTSIGANYRAACRGRSPADVIAKLKIVEEEADESLYWMEMLIDAEVISSRKLAPLMAEVDEVLAMTVSSIKTLRAKRK